MRFKLIATLLGSALLLGMLAGCGGTDYAEDPVNPQTRFVSPGQGSTATNQSVVQSGLSQNGGVLSPVATNPSSMVPQPNLMPQPNSTVLRPQDKLIVSFGDVPVPPPPIENRIPEDGYIVLPFNVRVKAAGKTASQLQEEIRAAYVPKFFNRLTVNIKTEDRFFFVGGEVRMPTQRIYSSEMTVLRAIDTAGGFTEYANRKKIELHRANGRKEIINWYNAIKDPLKYDRPVDPNDKITVHRRIW